MKVLSDSLTIILFDTQNVVAHLLLRRRLRLVAIRVGVQQLLEQRLLLRSCASSTSPTLIQSSASCLSALSAAPSASESALCAHAVLEAQPLAVRLALRGRTPALTVQRLQIPASLDKSCAFANSSTNTKPPHASTMQPGASGVSIIPIDTSQKPQMATPTPNYANNALSATTFPSNRS